MRLSSDVISLAPGSATLDAPFRLPVLLASMAVLLLRGLAAAMLLSPPALILAWLLG